MRLSELSPSPAGPAAADDPMRWVKDAATVAGSVLALVNQQKLNDVNFRRAAAGLPPITMDQIPGAVPTVQVGVESKTRDLIMWGGIGVLSLVGLAAILKARRRI